MARTGGINNNFLHNSGAIVTALPCTMACWFNAVNITADHNLMSSVSSGSGNAQGLFAAGATGGDPIGAYAVNSGTATAATSTGFTANTWHHACGVFASATDRRAFLNGGGKGTNATSKAFTTPAHTNLKAYSSDGTTSAGNTLDGAIAEAAIWSVALSDDEVAAIASGSANPLDWRRSSLLAYWHLLGSSLVDATGNGNTMSVVGTVTVADGPPVRMPFARKGKLFLPAAAAASTTYTQLERGTRGLCRGVLTGRSAN